uniref:Uncharacterized protein n=1 Tax=Ananas comosus var. bracteatus TaxID=296719 RepID=A0A6V7NFM5_ANACO|nr:unnamed protein product [Ananas comosus var. bracteatus]
MDAEMDSAHPNKQNWSFARFGAQNKFWVAQKLSADLIRTGSQFGSMLRAPESGSEKFHIVNIVCVDTWLVVGFEGIVAGLEVFPAVLLVIRDRVAARGIAFESLIELDRDTLYTRLDSSHEYHFGDGRCAFALVSLMPIGLALHGLVVWRATVVGCCCRRLGSRQGRHELEPYQTCRARGTAIASYIGKIPLYTADLLACPENVSRVWRTLVTVLEELRLIQQRKSLWFETSLLSGSALEVVTSEKTASITCHMLKLPDLALGAVVILYRHSIDMTDTPEPSSSAAAVADQDRGKGAVS